MITTEEDNPYKSPVETGTQGLAQRPLRPGVRSRLLAKGLLYRRVLLEAPVEAVVEFKGRSLRDVILVDNQIVSSHISWWRITPRFQFNVPAGDQMLPAEVELNLGHFLQIKGFCVKVGGVVAYLEGTVK